VGKFQQRTGVITTGFKRDSGGLKLSMPRRITWLSNVMAASVTGLEDDVARSIEVVENPRERTSYRCASSFLSSSAVECL
jgi:hypothetical protein